MLGRITKWSARWCAAAGVLLALAAPAMSEEAPQAAGGAAPDVIVVRVLSRGTCANTPLAMELVEKTARELGLKIDLAKQMIETEEDMVRHRFFGSPTVQIDGLDLEVPKRAAGDFRTT